MNFLSQTVSDLLPVYLTLIFFLFALKPGMFFKPNGKPREYGFGRDSEGFRKTLLTLQTAILLACIFIFAVST